MTDFERDLKLQLAKEAGRVPGMPHDLSSRIVAGAAPQPATWLRAAPVAVAALFVAAVGLALLNAHPPRNAGPSLGAASSPSPSLEPSPAPTGPAASAPAGLLGPFVCGPGAQGGTTSATGNLTAVRVAHQAGFDRVTFEFAGTGLPPYSVARQAGTGFTEDASGRAVSLRGDQGMKITFHGASGQGTYNGSTDIILPPALGAADTLAEVRQIGDFERVLSWAAGMNSPTCTRVVELASPSRLVIDVAKAAG